MIIVCTRFHYPNGTLTKVYRSLPEFEHALEVANPSDNDKLIAQRWADHKEFILGECPDGTTLNVNHDGDWLPVAVITFLP